MEENLQENKLPYLSSLIEACKKGNVTLLKETLAECDKEDINPFQINTGLTKSPTLFHVASISHHCPLEVLEELITSYRNWSKKLHRQKWITTIKTTSLTISEHSTKIRSSRGSGLISYLTKNLTSDGYTALHCACKSNKLDFVYVFVRELHFYGISDNGGVCTPFDVACRFDCRKIALFLLQKCRNVYKDYSSGLIIAYQNKNTDLIKETCKIFKITVQVLNSLCHNVENHEIVNFCIEKKLCKQEGKQLLQMAASEGQLDLLKYLLQSPNGFSIRICVDKTGANLYHFAVTNDHLACVEFLLTIKDFLIMAVTKNKDGERPINIAKYNNDILSLFKNSLKLSPLHMLCINREKRLFALLSHNDEQELFKALYNKEPFPFRQDATGNTVLHYACENTQIEFLNILLEKKEFDLGVQNSNGDTPLHILAREYCKICQKEEGRRITAERLLQGHLKVCLTKFSTHNTFNPILRNNRKETLLFILLTKLNLHKDHSRQILKSLIETIIKSYFALNNQFLSEDVLKIIQYYCQYRYKCEKSKNTQEHPFIEFISKLTSSEQFNPNTTDSNNNTCLHFATACVWPELVEHLLKKPSIHLNMFNNDNKSPFHNLIAHFGHCNVLKLIDICNICSMLINKGLSVDLQEPVDDKGNTLVHIACMIKSATLLKSLSQQSSFCKVLNHPNKSGKAPLHLLCSHARHYISVECFQILLDFPDINVSQPDTVSNQTPLDILAASINIAQRPIMYKKTKDSIILLTKHHSFKPDLYTKPEYFNIWCQVGCTDIVSKIVSVDPSLLLKQNRYNQNVLHIACLNFNSQLAKYLLEQKCASQLVLEYDYFDCAPFHSLCWKVSRHSCDGVDDNYEDKAIEILKALTKLESVKDIVNKMIRGVETVLHMLSRSRYILSSNYNLKFLEELLNVSTIDPNVKNCFSKTPLQLAKGFSFCEDMKEKLLLRHPKIDTSSYKTHSSDDFFLLEFNGLCDSHDDISLLDNEVLSSKKIQELLLKDIHIKDPAFFETSVIDFCDKKDGNTTLHIACRLRKVDVVLLLLKNENTNVCSYNKQQETPMHVFLKETAQDFFKDENDSNIFFSLVNHSIFKRETFCIKNSEGNNCLHLVCDTKQSFINFAEEILNEKRIQVGEVNINKQTVFHMIANHSCSTLYFKLKEHCSFTEDVLNIQDNEGNTCLHIACNQYIIRDDCFEMILDMCKIPGIINVQNNQKKTPLHLCRKLLFAISNTLLPDLSIKDCEGNNPIMYFLNDLFKGKFNVDKGSISANLNYLISFGSFHKCINQVNIDNDTILHCAAEKLYGNPLLSKLIINLLLSVPSSNPNIKNKDGNTLMHIIAIFHHHQLFDQLCKQYSKIDLSILNNKGQTPLHIVCSNYWWYSENYFDQLMMLTTEGDLNLDNTAYNSSDLSIIDEEDGNTPLHVACSNGHLYYIKLLCQGIPNINIQNSSGQTPLHRLSVWGNEEVYKQCWEVLTNHSFFDPNAQNNEGDTVLHKICRYYKPDLSLVKFLLEHEKFDINLKNSQGLTCLQVVFTNYYNKESKQLVELINKYSPEIRWGSLQSFQLFLSYDHGILGFGKSHCNSQCFYIMEQHLSISAQTIVNEETGDTALHLACQVICPAVIRRFLQRQQSLCTFPKNIKNQTPLHVLALGIKLQSESEKSYVLLEVSYLKKKIAKIGKYDWKMLFNCGINEKDELGNTALHYACEAESVLMLNSLASNPMCNFEIRNNANKLPLTIAQETGNQSFYLRVLIKFFERKDNQRLADYYRTVLNDGAIEMRPVKCILTGPPGAGKTTLKNRLLGDASGSTTSTGVAETPQVIAVRDVSQLHTSFHSSGKEWTPVDCRDQVEALLQTVSNDIHKAIESVTNRVTYELSSLTVSNDKPLNHDHQPSSNSHFSIFNTNNFKSNFKLWQKRQEEFESKAKTKTQFKSFEYQLKELRKLVNSVPSKKSKSDPQKFTVKDLSVNPFVRIVDTGGQPELHELLPAFITGPAINLIVFNLEYSLKKSFPVFYRSTNKKYSPIYDSCINHEDTILRSLSSIACLGHSQQLKQYDDNDSIKFFNPVAFLVGSHEDEVEKEDIDTINHELRSVIESSEIYCTSDIVNYYTEKSILYPVNGLDPSCIPIDLLRKNIFKAIEQNFPTVPVPVSWLILSIRLQFLLETKSIRSVIDINECFKIAQTCGIQTIDQLKNDALWFLHNTMGSLMYYSDIPELESKVILDIQAIFNTVTKLLTSCFLFTTIGSKLAEEDFYKLGYFTENSLRKVLKVNSDSIPFSVKELIALLQHLHVIVNVGTEKYFMPTALKPFPDPVSSTNDCPPPLVISFECGYTPVGVFTSLVAKLLSHDDNECKLVKDTPQYRNMIKLCIGPHCAHIMLIARPCYIEISLESNHSDTLLSNICQEIRLLIDVAIKTVIQSLHYKFNSKHFFGFICTAPTCTTHAVHATIISDKSLSNKYGKCPRANCPVPLTNQQLIWYGIKEESLQDISALATSSLSDDMSHEIFNRILGIEELDKVIELLSDLVEWQKVGLQLGLLHPALKKIKADETTVDSCSMEMLACWLQKKDRVESKGGPTWKQLVCALHKAKESELADSVVKELMNQI